MNFSYVASPLFTETSVLLQILQEQGPDAKEGQFPGRNMGPDFRWMGHDSLNNYPESGLSGSKRKNVSSNFDK